MKIMLAAGLVLELLVRGTASSQLPVDPRLISAVAQTDSGTLVRFETQGTHIGRIVRIGRDSVLLAEESGHREVALRDVRLAYRGSNEAVHGAKVGGIVGSIIGAAYGLLVATALCERSCGPEGYIGMGALGGGVVGLGGAMLGGVVGLFMQGWAEVYSRE